MISIKAPTLISIQCIMKYYTCTAKSAILIITGILLFAGCTTTIGNNSNSKVFLLTPEQADNLIQNVMTQRYTFGVSKLAFNDGRIGYQKTSRMLLDSDEIALIAVPVDNIPKNGKIGYKLQTIRSGTRAISGQVEASNLYKMAEATATAVMAAEK